MLGRHHIYRLKNERRDRIRVICINKVLFQVKRAPHGNCTGTQVQKRGQHFTSALQPSKHDSDCTITKKAKVVAIVFRSGSSNGRSTQSTSIKRIQAALAMPKSSFTRSIAEGVTNQSDGSIDISTLR